MPVNGPYEFRLSTSAKAGLVEDAVNIEPGAWAWYKNDGFLAVFACCPDCKQPMTLWRRFGADTHGHQLDSRGNLHPSVLHSFPVNGVETCGFHSMPTRLLDFVDLR